MTIRQLLLGTAPALMLAITPAYAASKCVTAHDDQPITVRGTIVQSATTEEGEGGNPPHKYMAVVLETPICGDPDEMKTIAVDPVSMKWLGHDAFVTGIMTPTGEGSYIAVQHIIDGNTSEETIMDWRDTAAVVNEICPDLSNAGWLAALVNAHDSRAWNRAAASSNANTARLWRCANCMATANLSAVWCGKTSGRKATIRSSIGLSDARQAHSSSGHPRKRTRHLW
jgi:hypothetical protein